MQRYKSIMCVIGKNEGNKSAFVKVLKFIFFIEYPV